MILPSSTYANTSALCWCAGTTSPGERRTVSIRPSFPGRSGRVFVIRDVSFAIWRFALLEACDWNSTNARMNNENTHILLIYKLLIRSRGSEAAADVFEFVELAPAPQATLCHFDQDCFNRTTCLPMLGSRRSLILAETKLISPIPSSSFVFSAIGVAGGHPR